MRRRYSIARFLEKIARMKERLDRPAFTTDMIVGFPGETEADFELSAEACRRVGFVKVHVFPFSARAGTKAATFADALPPAVIRERVSRLSELERELAEEYYRTLENERLEVLVEQGVPARPGYVRGTDRRYVPVELPGDANDLGQFVTAVGQSESRDCLFAIRA
jgi:threonylcarbamoyladenosine tRNA methylthiotransferase MtaB